MAKHFWPAFRPKQQLPAQELYAFERYLLARNRVLPRLAHGVTSLSFERGFRYDEPSKTLVVSDLRGLTPGGYPIVVRPEGSPNPTEGDDALSVRIEDMSVFDLFVSIQTEPLPELDNQTAGRKLQLETESVHKQGPPAELRADRLYLGRIEIVDEQLSIHTKPIAHHLGALEDRSMLDEWTTPFKSAVNQLVQQLSDIYRTQDQRNRNPSLVGAMVTAQQLQTTWSQLSWAELSDLVSTIQSLLPGTLIQDDIEWEARWDPESASGENQPHELARTLLPQFVDGLEQVYALKGCRTEGLGEQIYVVVRHEIGVPEIVHCRLIPTERPRGNRLLVAAVEGINKKDKPTLLMNGTPSSLLEVTGGRDDLNTDSKNPLYYFHLRDDLVHNDWIEGVELIVRQGRHVTYPLTGLQWSNREAHTGSQSLPNGTR